LAVKPLSRDQLERVLFVAQTQVNVTESPPNTNKGLKVEEYQRAVGIQVGKDPWCAGFLGWVGKTALGDDWPVPLVGGCATLADWAKKEGVLKDKPQLGDAFLLFFPKLNRYAHVGFVTDPVKDGKWGTIEGNTSGGGSREGWGVFRQRRAFGLLDRFIRLGE
jgi:hypothetical protein